MVSPAQELRRVPWGLILLQGIISLLIGILIVISPGIALVILVQFLGIYWLVSGILNLASIFQDRSLWGWKLTIGIIGIFAGIVVIQSPLWSTALVAATLVVILGISGIFIGIVQVIEGFAGGGLGQIILGVVSSLLGLVLVFNTLISAVTLVWLVGILAIGGGIAAIIQAFRQRAVEAQGNIPTGGRPIL